MACLDIRSTYKGLSMVGGTKKLLRINARASMYQLAQSIHLISTAATSKTAEFGVNADAIYVGAAPVRMVTMMTDTHLNAFSSVASPMDYTAIGHCMTANLTGEASAIPAFRGYATLYTIRITEVCPLHYIHSCYGAGYWIDDMAWADSDAWKD